MPYSDSLSLLLARHAVAAYQRPDDFWQWAIDQNYEGAVSIERGSTQIGIAYSEERIVIAARGSSQLGDWFENALSFRVPWRALFPFGTVHFGFQLQARRIVEEFRQTICRLHRRYPKAEVYVTGHSLGGALCPFIARLLDLESIRATAVYTFESPRIGNEAFARWFDGRYGNETYRVVAVRNGVVDLVPRIPPSSWGYWHVGQPIMIRDGYRYPEESSPEAWEKLRKQHPVKALAHWRIFSRLSMGVQAHFGAKLVRDLEEIVKRSSNVAELIS